MKRKWSKSKSNESGSGSRSGGGNKSGSESGSTSESGSEFVNRVGSQSEYDVLYIVIWKTIPVK